MYIKLVDLPNTLQKALNDLAYRKSDIKIDITPSVSLFCAGSQGRQSFATIVNIETGEKSTSMGSWSGANMFNPTNSVDLDQKEYILPVNGAVIKGSRGHGGVFATIYVSPSNIVQAFQTNTVDITPNERGLLQVLRGIKGGHRKEYIFGRYSREYFDAPLTQTTYNETSASLVSKGMIKINKLGAMSLTTSGKNAIG